MTRAGRAAERIASGRGGRLPTPQQELLLRAAFGSDASARESWLAWNRQSDIQALDGRSFSLLPLVHANLARLRVSGPHMKTLKGITRYTWSRNQGLLSEITPLLHALSHSGVEILLVRDLALANLYYRGHGVRPIGGLHLVASAEQLPIALRVSGELGWGHGSIGRTQREARPPYTMRRPSGASFSLECQVFEGWEAGRADAAVWDATRSEHLSDVSVRVLCPTDQLLDTCARGVRWNAVPDPLWVADALTILASLRGEVEWNRLIRIAATARVALSAGEALEYLRTVFGVAVPDGIGDRLKATSPSPRERAAYRARTRPLAPTSRLMLHWYSFSERAPDRSTWWRVTRFPAYLQQIWGLTHAWQVPFHAWRVGVHRFAEMRQAWPLD